MPLVAMQFPCIRPSLSEKSTSTSHLGPDHLHQNVSVSSEAARHGTDMSGPGKHMRRHLSIIASTTSKIRIRAILAILHICATQNWWEWQAVRAERHCDFVDKAAAMRCTRLHRMFGPIVSSIDGLYQDSSIG